MRPAAQAPTARRIDPTSAQEQAHWVAQHSALTQEHDLLGREVNQLKMDAKKPPQTTFCQRFLIVAAVTGWVAAAAMAYVTNWVYTTPGCKLVIDAMISADNAETLLQTTWSHYFRNDDQVIN